MDVNGTRFHLIIGEKDWLRCQEEGTDHGSFQCVAYDGQTEQLMLKPLLTLFPRRSNQLLLEPSARRGAAVDRFGNYYRIANDRQRIFWQPSGTKQANVYWTQKRACCGTQTTGKFQPVVPDTEVSELAGLAVTEHHYLGLET